MIASTIESFAEALALVEKNGIDRQAFYDLMTSTLFGGAVHKGYGKLIATKTHSPAGFTCLLGHKDMGLVQNEAEKARCPMPMASMVKDRLLSLLAEGNEDLDWSALGLKACKDAGL